MPTSSAVKAWGWNASATAGKQNLDPIHGYSGLVVARVDDGTWVPIAEEEGTEKFYVLSTLVSNLEPAFMISPKSKVGENAMWVLTFPKLPAEEVMTIMGGARVGGTHVQDSKVNYQKVTGIRIEPLEADERWRRICVDGRIAVLEEDGWVEATVVEGEGGVSALWKD